MKTLKGPSNPFEDKGERRREGWRVEITYRDVLSEPSSKKSKGTPKQYDCKDILLSTVAGMAIFRR